jgi:hypothetical protein
VPTVERLGSMTPEELDAMGIGADMVEQIQLSVNGYYGQFESPADDDAAASVESDAAASVDGAEASVDLVEQAILSPAVESELEAASEPSEASGEATPAATAEANGAKTGGEKSDIENESVTIKNTEGLGER